MSLLQRFKDYISNHQLFNKSDHLLVAVSGGVDSVILCYLLKDSGAYFSIAHCNFSLRGEESNRDELFVRELADELNVSALVKKFDTKEYAEKNKISIQEAARKLRYEWFQQIVNGEEQRNTSDAIVDLKSFPQYIVTAHHKDDNIETAMMNFFRGTGITGLRGIQPKKGNIIRPLLFAYKEDMMQYAQHQGIKWVHDSSNDESDYTRNYLRQAIIPSIQKVYPAVKQNIADNFQRFGDVELVYKQGIEFHKKKFLEYKENEVHIPVLKLQKAIPLHTIVFEVIKEFGFGSHQVSQVIKLLSGESGKYITSLSHRILRNRAWLIISPLYTSAQNIILIEQAEEEKVFDGYRLKIKPLIFKHKSVTTDESMAEVDAKEIHFPLILRKWKTGDYFYPLGMRKKKKIARFFIDQKLSQTEKEKVWVLETNKKIIWIIGMRIDDRFKVTNNTTQILKFSLSNL